MGERKILTAKSYQGLPFVSEPYTLNGKEYIKVRMKNGSIKQVRSYTESEYRKYNPEVKIIQPAKSRKNILGFGEEGFIWLFKGKTSDAIYANLDWFKSSPCRYTRSWGWYLPSDIELPTPLPVNIEPIKLMWDEVSFNDQLISEEEIHKVVDHMIYDKGNSHFVGKPGERLEFDGVLQKAVISEGYFGISYFYVFFADDEVIYTWSTTSKSLNEGQRYHVRGTLKEHTEYRNQEQNVLTRCSVVEIE